MDPVKWTGEADKPCYYGENGYEKRRDYKKFCYL